MFLAYLDGQGWILGRIDGLEGLKNGAWHDTDDRVLPRLLEIGTKLVTRAIIHP